MPKAILKFNLPEENAEFQDAINGSTWHLVLQDLDNFLREKLKYGHDYKSADEALEEVRDFLYETLKDYNLSLF